MLSFVIRFFHLELVILQIVFVLLLVLKMREGTFSLQDQKSIEILKYVCETVREREREEESV